MIWLAAIIGGPALLALFTAKTIRSMGGDKQHQDDVEAARKANEAPPMPAKYEPMGWLP